MKRIQLTCISILVILTLFSAVGCWSPTGNNTDDAGSSIRTVTIRDIMGVPMPSAGETPATSITETDEYTGTITWDPRDDTFEEDTVYTATITLTAKSGYTFNGVTQDFFMLLGATTSNPANSGLVNAQFPSTGNIENGIEAGTQDVRTVSSTSFIMVYVPGDHTFIMGEDGLATTQEVTLTKGYWMGRTELTQKLWEAVMGSSWPGGQPLPDGDTYPAHHLNWYDAVAFCNALTLADTSVADNEVVYYADATLETVYTSGTDVYPDWTKKGYRLPTEAEWEYAARWIDGSNWNGGDHVSGGPVYTDTTEPDVIGDYAWYEENANGSAHMMAEKTANALGLYDMSGNVREWCYDWFADYSGDHEDDPHGPETPPGPDPKRIARGGHFDTKPSTRNTLTCTTRMMLDPLEHAGTFGTTYVGFRLCRTAD